MKLAAWINRFRSHLEHPLSPAPLVVLFVGYWMPLEWMIKGDSLFGSSPWMERLHAIATSVWLNFFPVSLICAIAAYAIAWAISLLFRCSFVQIAARVIGFSTFIVLIAVSGRELQFATIGLFTASFRLKLICTFVMVVCSLWLAYKNCKLMRWMQVSTYLAGIILPLSFLFVLMEFGSHAWHQSGLQQATSPNGNNRPDIILVTVDTLSALHLHSYGYQRPTSPHLDDLSSNAILFENFYANANWTRPGIASILNGVRPWTHEGDLGIPLKKVTETNNLVTRLANAGYDIRMVNSNDFADLEWQGIPNGVAHRSITYPISKISKLLYAWLPSYFLVNRIGPYQLIENKWSVIFRPEIAAKTRAYLPLSEALLHSTDSDRPLFFWLHIYSPHSPYATQAPYLCRFDSSPLARTPERSICRNGFVEHGNPEQQQVLVGRYDEAVLMADDVIGGLVDLLKKQGRFDRSLVVMTADHGDSFHPRYNGHGGPLFSEELIHVPCLIKPPYYHEARRETLPFEQVDLAPTILSYAHLPIPAGMEGQPYQTKLANVPIFSMNRDRQVNEHTLSLAERDGDWKYIVHMGHWTHPWPQKELYNIAEDPKESTNLVDRQPERVAAMQQRILQELAKHGVDTREYE